MTHRARLQFFMLISLISAVHVVRAQYTPPQTDTLHAVSIVPDTMTHDSAQRTISSPSQSRLLPKNISFGEQLMWGENGVMRSIGIVPALSPQERKFELSLRRTMLTTHQIGGFVSLGLMAASTYYGQQVLNGRYDLLGTHKTLVGATILTYTATGMLSVLSPPPLIRRDDESSTTTLHKTLAWVHFAGMVITPILGKMIRNSTDYNTAARFHQVSAYITTATFAASLIVITF